MSDNHRVDFADLRARADFRTVLAHYDIAIKGAGDQVKALCPLHDDERPSLSIQLGEKVFHCFAPNCPAHEGGDILDFVHLMETHRGSTTSLRQAGITLARPPVNSAPCPTGGEDPVYAELRKRIGSVRRKPPVSRERSTGATPDSGQR